MSLIEIQLEVHRRVAEIEAGHQKWPCRKGCDDCCRSLASEPRVSREEWDRIAVRLDDAARDRVRQSASLKRPVTCPLLDRESGSCLVYEVRPIACRTYGFYAERAAVLGCSRIEALGENTPAIVWGNHLAVESRLAELGEAKPFSTWLVREAIEIGHCDSPRS